MTELDTYVSANQLLVDLTYLQILELFRAGYISKKEVKRLALMHSTAVVRSATRPKAHLR